MIEWLPNVAAKPQGPHHGGALVPQFVVLHHTGGRYPTDLQVLMGKTRREVSVHFYVARDGATFQLQPCNVVAYHAGISELRHDGRSYSGMNHYALGIEFENLNGNEHDYPGPQIMNGVRLVEKLMRAFPVLIDPTRWVTHQQIAPGRKIDPGSKFPLNELREYIKERFSNV